MSSVGVEKFNPERLEQHKALLASISDETMRKLKAKATMDQCTEAQVIERLIDQTWPLASFPPPEHNVQVLLGIRGFLAIIGLVFLGVLCGSILGAYLSTPSDILLTQPHTGGSQ